MSDLSCSGIRELLGVYVVGAIEPAERSVVDRHLSHCHNCREELAGLAGLPALLRRVPLADAERLASPGGQAGDLHGPQPELLASLLRRVTDRRRTRRLRAVFATAAALLIAIGGGAAVTRAIATHQAHTQTTTAEDASATSGGRGATVRYDKSPWGGTRMRIHLTGFRPGTTCRFWVLTKNGRPSDVGGWTIGASGPPQWYWVGAPVPEASVTGFMITSGKTVLLQIPAPA